MELELERQAKKSPFFFDISLSCLSYIKFMLTPPRAPYFRSPLRNIRPSSTPPHRIHALHTFQHPLCPSPQSPHPPPGPLPHRSLRFRPPRHRRRDLRRHLASDATGIRNRHLRSRYVHGTLCGAYCWRVHSQE